jgi:hypothetical protein
MRRYAWAVLWLGLVAGTSTAVGQDDARPPVVQLKQNYPNPFNPATTIPFALGAELFADGHRPKVTLKIYNVLAQLVAVPILQGAGQPLDGLELTCDGPSGCSYTAYWDGTVLNTGREAASGVYIYQLVVDGQRLTRKMVVAK